MAEEKIVDTIPENEAPEKNSEALENPKTLENDVEEKLANPETLADLKMIATKTEEKIKKNYDQDETLAKGLQASVSTKINLPPELEILEEKVSQAEAEAIKQIELEVAAEKALTEHLKNYDTTSAEAALIEHIPADPKVQERFDSRISPAMKGAAALLGKNVFNNCHYGYELIGSNCYIPHTEYSAKIPDDLDIIFGIRDLDKVQNDLSALEKQGLIKDLHSVELTKFGREKNGCVKISAQVKTETGWIPMEAFAQNMISEIKNGEKLNGIINLGAEKQSVEVIDCNGVKINIGSEATAKELYLKNITNEFTLYDLNGWENRSYLNAKALQRLFNITNLDGEKFESSMDDIIKDIEALDPPTLAAQRAQKVLTNLWENFKKSDYQGSGLIDHILDKNKESITATDKNAEEIKVLKTEKAVDLMTKETQADMAAISEAYKLLKKDGQEILARPNKDAAATENLLNKISDQLATLVKTENKYQVYESQVNSEQLRDFCVYAAIPRLRDYFIKPTMVRLFYLRNKLQAQE